MAAEDLDSEDTSLLDEQKASSLRPYGEGSVVLRLWQRLCSFIPALVLGFWTIAILFCLIKRPLWMFCLLCVDLCWGIWEQSRWAVNGCLAAHKILQGASRNSDAFSTQHACFIATYKEDTEVLRQTLLSIANQKGAGLNGQSFARSFIGVNLCYEQREGKRGQEQAALLINEFKDQFSWMTSIFHPADIPGDLMGKCSNIRWSIDQSQHQRASQSTLVTVIDADSNFDLEYFAEVSERYEEMECDIGYATIFQPTILHFGNYYDQSGIVRFASILSSIANACYLEDFFYLQVPYATFTVPWALLDKVGNFCPDYVADDWHLGVKSFLVEPLKAQVVHIPLPVVNYGVEGESFVAATEERMWQGLRHALGVEEIAYILQMIPVCIARQRTLGAQCCDVIQILLRFLRYLVFFSCVHIRLALGAPATLALLAFVAGVLFRTWQPDGNAHWPLYGATAHEFATNRVCFVYICLYLVWWLLFQGSTAIAVHLTKHLVAIDRMTSEVPWWGKSRFQYFYEALTCFWWSLIVYLCAGLSECIAICRIPFLDKKAFIYHVASKPQLSNVGREE